MCETLGAHRLCANYEPIQPVREAPTDELSYDYLNVQALHWGWMHAGRRGMRMRATKQFVRQVFGSSTKTWPLACPSQGVQHKLLETSMRKEREIFGFVNTSKHREDFFQAPHRLCVINASEILLANETVWRGFYESLH